MRMASDFSKALQDALNAEVNPPQSFSGVGVVVAVCLSEGLQPSQIDEVWNHLVGTRPDDSTPSGIISQIKRVIENLYETDAT
jgi:hypothetical protein